MNPRNPESLPWIVAFNAKEDKNKKPLSSTFVAVVEPFKGSSKIDKILPLPGKGKPPPRSCGRSR